MSVTASVAGTVQDRVGDMTSVVWSHVSVREHRANDGLERDESAPDLECNSEEGAARRIRRWRR